MLSQILIVDDDQDALDVLQMGLSNLECDILLASNGFEGVLRAFKDLPDVIVADVLMPDMDGIEFFQLLKAHPLARDIPVIMVSVEDIRDFSPEGVAGALRKSQPGFVAMLRHMVSDILASSPQ